MEGDIPCYGIIYALYCEISLTPTFTFFRPNLLENRRHGLDQTLALQYQYQQQKHHLVNSSKSGNSDPYLFNRGTVLLIYKNC